MRSIVTRGLGAVALMLALSFIGGKAGAAGPYSFGVVPQFEQRKLHSIWDPVIAQIAQRAGITIELVSTLTIQDFETAYVTGAYDFAYMNPYYILAASKVQGYLPLVRDKAPLAGVLVVRQDSAVQSAAELDGKTVAFPTPNAIGASLLMRADLARTFRVNVVPLYVKTHSAVYLNVLAGEAVAGGGVEKTLAEQDTAVRQGLRVIHTTRDFPSHPVAAHPRVPVAVREAVRRAFLAMYHDETGRALLAKVPMQEVVSTSLQDYTRMADLHLDELWDPH